MLMTGLVHVTHFHIVVVPLVGRNFGVLMDLVGINFSDNVANMVCVTAVVVGAYVRILGLVSCQ